MLRGAFDQWVNEYDPFFGGPTEPSLPYGALAQRSMDGKLPKSQFGRGVPFPEYLMARVRRFFGRTAEAREATGDDEAVEDWLAESDEGPARDARGGGGKDTLVFPILTDDDGTEWITIAHLSSVSGLSEDVLRKEEARGFLKFERRKRMRVIRYEPASIGQLCQELMARHQLRTNMRTLAQYAGGWDPSREYMTDRPHLEWKIAQMRRLLDDELPAFLGGIGG